jgi:hypothetical protein
MLNLPIELLVCAVGLGATVAGFVTALRALPMVQKAIMARKKPWACNICMSFWSTGAAAIGLAVFKNDVVLLLSAGPAYPVALWILSKLEEPQLPPQLPPLQES